MGSDDDQLNSLISRKNDIKKYENFVMQSIKPTK